MMIFKQSYLDELRNPNNYLSDIIIEFYFNYLSSIHPSDSILFVPPTISFLIANSVDPAAIKECLKSLELTAKRLVIFPVNNSGIHWSLLVYYRDSDYFIHRDSMKGINHWEASRLYRAVKEHVRPTSKKRRFYPDRFYADEDPVFRAALTPQQTNGYDCGLYVMAIAKVICQWYCNDDPDKVTWIKEVQENVDVTLELTLRPHVLELIEEASCGRLGSVSCAIEADEPKDEEGASDRGTPKEEGASDRGTPKEEGVTRIGPVPDDDEVYRTGS